MMQILNAIRPRKNHKLLDNYPLLCHTVPIINRRIAMKRKSSKSNRLKVGRDFWYSVKIQKVVCPTKMVTIQILNSTQKKVP